MSGFELVTITFSFVLGLGVAQILSSVGFVLRERRTQELHWAPLCVAGAIFLAHVQFWFALFNLDRALTAWTPTFYWSLMTLAVVLFLSGVTVLPSARERSGESLLQDFETRGKLSLLLLAAYMLGWIPLNIWFDGGAWLISGVFFNLVIALTLVIAYWARDRAVRATATVSFLALELIGVLFVWATPEVLG